MRTMIAAAAFVAAMGCNIPAAYAFGDAPWCAVKNFGSDVVWDCEYRTVEECVPHVIAGDRSFCNLIRGQVRRRWRHARIAASGSRSADNPN